MAPTWLLSEATSPEVFDHSDLVLLGPLHFEEGLGAQ